MGTQMTTETVPVSKLQDLIRVRTTNLEQELHILRSRMGLMKESYMLQKAREKVVSLEQAIYLNKKLTGDLQ